MLHMLQRITLYRPRYTSASHPAMGRVKPKSLCTTIKVVGHTIQVLKYINCEWVWLIGVDDKNT